MVEEGVGAFVCACFENIARCRSCLGRILLEYEPTEGFHGQDATCEMELGRRMWSTRCNYLVEWFEWEVDGGRGSAMMPLPTLSKSVDWDRFLFKLVCQSDPGSWRSSKKGNCIGVSAK